ncbi:LysR family transcriptional regulator [Paraburkholderia pallida]|uniref:LysR family transcriptional regulator n=1 Tax=Paraburkholderia pallida TaxID=2547399 RepID=A0A4P7DAB8_9BURK|nr:LysR family transcriptional regulator [Paraburkholderia pallida]QBR03672.1 LysR family transcriptional regulator [Paraburkholderia pallida]
MINLLHAMQVFVRVADAGSFAQAASQLNVSTSIVTRHVANLESHLGIRLFQRTTRKTALTEAGREYMVGCRSVLDEIEELEARATLTSREIAGDLRIVASGSFSLFQLAPFFAEYQREYPRVVLRVILTEQPVDLLDAGFDVGIVVDRMITSSSLIARRLVRASRVPVAAPRYLTGAGSPRIPTDLAKHRILSQTQETGTLSWTFAKEDQEQIVVNPSFTVNNATMLKQAALAGMGIAMLPAGLVSDDLLAGNLIRLLPDYTVVNSDVEVSLVYPSRQYIPQKVRTFIDRAIEYFR